ncbi:MAG: hypothetical protein M3268_05410 [Acidobacteriota bacterium]|nr:hypothetical protein [Acidobacteriota bacterium]
MKSQIVKVVTSLSFFALLCTAAHAQAAHQPLRAHVPFDFAVGREEMPAGDYEIRFVSTATNLQTVQLVSLDGRASRLLQMSSVEGGKINEGGRMIFRRYGSLYFLSQVWEPAERTGLALRRSRAEREVELAGGSRAALATVQIALGK